MRAVAQHAVCCAGAWLLVLIASALAAAAEPIDVRVRLAWGGGESRAWQGTIHVSAGSLSDCIPLGLDADVPGSMLSIDSATIEVLPRSPRSYDGCDVRVRAPADAKLLVTLAGTDEPPGEPIEIPLARVVQELVQLDLDNRRNRLLAERSPGDALRVTYDRASLVFSPGERFEMSVEPSPVGLSAGSSYLLAASLGPARSEEAKWSEDFEVAVSKDGKLAAAQVKPSLPMEEGVYDLRLSLYPKRLTTSLVRGKPIVSRKVQLVVVAPVVRLERDVTPWETVIEFDPAHPHWWERMTRMPSLRKLPTLPPAPVGSGKTTTLSHLKHTWLELPPGGWQGYPLSVAEPGQPHVLEVEYPSDLEQTLSISLVEPNAARQVGPIGVDSGIDVSAPHAGHVAEARRHRILFWPQTRSPFVLLVNRRDDLPSRFGRIRVLAGPRELEALDIPQSKLPGRTLAAYYDKPLFAENFGASEAVDAKSSLSRDDWQTFYDGGRRLIQTLEHGGYNALVLTAACEGSGLYPSELLQPTPNYDTGTFFENGQDPRRKDVLELLLRLCDRSGIQLIPAVQFASPLPQLEAFRRAGGDESVGMDAIGRDGRSWRERAGPRRGMGPYYNPLDPRVQQAMVAVVAELAERYGHHPSFGGVAVQLSSEGYTLLADETCSFDDRTVARFVAATGEAIPGNDHPDLAQRLAAREAHLNGPAMHVWLAWRSRELTNLYARMREEVVRHRASAKLMLTTGDLLCCRPLQLALRPTLAGKSEPAELFSLLGLDLAELEAQGIVVPRPQRIVTASSPQARDLYRHWNAQPELDALFAPQGRAAALHMLEPAPLRLPEFDAVSPFGSDKTRTLLVSQIAPEGAAQRERFALSMARLDAPLMLDGGWLLPLGQEAALAPLVEVYRRLPAEPFATPLPKGPPAQTQGVTVRTLIKFGKTFFYAVNETPWPIDLEVDFECASAFRLTPYSTSREGVLRPSVRGQTWSVQMQPFDLVGGELSSDQAAVADWRIVPPAGAAEALRERVRDIRLRANALRWPTPRDLLSNPSFEAPAAPAAIPGWVHASGAGMTVGIEPADGHESERSLHLRSQAAAGTRAPAVWVRSDPFPTPTTGRLSVVAWIRVADPARQPKLRLAVEGKLDGHVYYKFASLGAADAGRDAPQLGTTWSAYRFPISNLPLSGLSDLRIGFDLMGEGEVWIDDVQVYDLWFEEEREYLVLNRTIAAADKMLSEGQLFGCQSFVDSYWPSFLRRQIPDPAALPAPASPQAVPRRTETAKPAESAAKPSAPPPKRSGWWPSWMRWR